MRTSEENTNKNKSQKKHQLSQNSFMCHFGGFYAKPEGIEGEPAQSRTPPSHSAHTALVAFSCVGASR